MKLPWTKAKQEEADDSDQLDRPGLHGKMDQVLGGCITGWAFDADEPQRRLRLDLYIDGQYHDTFAAMQYRSDLDRLRVGDGYHSFRYPLPPRTLDGQEHEIGVCFAGTKEALRASPRVLSVGVEGGHLKLTTHPKLAMDSNRFGVRTQPRLRRRDRKRKVPELLGESKLKLDGISVVIPTWNRGAMLEETLRISMECTVGAGIEFIVIDDGSSDDTPERLARMAVEMPALRFERVKNGGPGQARNIGVKMARHELVLFQGDDIRPACSDFYLHHLHAHRKYPHPGVAVLGKITWPDTREYPVNFVMSHIQGTGHQQFGYFGILPYTWLDWRFFYTSNVSMKKSCVADWTAGGFSPEFKDAGWEDAEFAYRLGLSVPGGFGCFYSPAPVAAHHHRYSVRQFVERETVSGRAARIFARLHPRVRKILLLDDLDRALASPWAPGGTPLPDLLSMLEGLKAWPSILEERYGLGSQTWHGDLLTAVFYVSFLQGYVMANEDPDVNYEAAYAYIIGEFTGRLGASPGKEAFGRFAPFATT